MDSLTHVVLGAVTGELLAGKKIGRRALVIGAIANSLPDIDVVCMAFMNIPDELLAHRGFTHSFLFAFLVAPLLGYLFSRQRWMPQLPWRQWTLFFLIELLLHCLTDSLTAYGTGLLEPFSHARYSLDTIFVADPFFTLPLLAGFIALVVLKPSSPRRKTWTKAALTLSAAYLAFTFINKARVHSIVLDNLGAQHIAHQEFLTTPTPFNNLLWYVLIRQDTGFQIAHYSLFDKTEDLIFYKFPQRASLRPAEPGDNDVQKLIRFSQGYYCFQLEHDTLVFSDMRFGQVGGWYMPEAPFVFRYVLAEGSANDIVIQRGRARASSREALKAMVDRIFRDR